jgi:hypothetical protein
MMHAHRFDFLTICVRNSMFNTLRFHNIHFLLLPFSGSRESPTPLADARNILLSKIPYISRAFIRGTLDRGICSASGGETIQK